MVLVVVVVVVGVYVLLLLLLWRMAPVEASFFLLLMLLPGEMRCLFLSSHAVQHTRQSCTQSGLRVQRCSMQYAVCSMRCDATMRGDGMRGRRENEAGETPSPQEDRCDMAQHGTAMLNEM